MYTRQILKKPNCTISSAFILTHRKSVLSFVVSVVTIGKAFRSVSFHRWFRDGGWDLWLNRLDVGRTSEGRRFKDIRLRMYVLACMYMLQAKLDIIVGYHSSILQTFVNSVLPRIMQRYSIYEVRSFDLRYFTSRRIKLIKSKSPYTYICTHVGKLYSSLKSIDSDRSFGLFCYICQPRTDENIHIVIALFIVFIIVTVAIIIIIIIIIVVINSFIDKKIIIFTRRYNYLVSFLEKEIFLRVVRKLDRMESATIYPLTSTKKKTRILHSSLFTCNIYFVASLLL